MFRLQILNIRPATRSWIFIPSPDKLNMFRLQILNIRPASRSWIFILSPDILNMFRLQTLNIRPAYTCFVPDLKSTSCFQIFFILPVSRSNIFVLFPDLQFPFRLQIHLFPDFLYPLLFLFSDFLNKSRLQTYYVRPVSCRSSMSVLFPADLLCPSCFLQICYVRT